MTFNLDDIRALMQDLENSSLRELSLEDEDLKLHLSKNEVAVAQPIANNVVAASTAIDNGEAIKEEHPLDREPKTGATINAPLVGTVYLRANPDSPAFKQVGDHVSVGEQVAIVEAMKLMTPVKSNVTGIITEVLVDEEEVVDYDKPMFRVDIDA